MALVKRGYKVASIYYWIPSNNTAFPWEIHEVNYLIHNFWLILIDVNDSPWDPLIQLEPWSCGSINNGHLEQDDITVAFSRLIESAGNPSLFHLALMASVVKTFNG